MTGFLTARGVLEWSCALATMLALGTLASGHVVVLAIRADSAHPLPLLEMVGVAGACVVPPLAAPRLWSWESVGARPALHTFAATLAAVLIALPAGIVGVCALVHPLPPAARAAAVSNTVLVAAISGLVATRGAPRLGPPAALAVYLSLTVVETMWPQLPRPMALGGVSATSTLTAGVLSVASVAVCGRWLGRCPVEGSRLARLAARGR